MLKIYRASIIKVVLITVTMIFYGCGAPAMPGHSIAGGSMVAPSVSQTDPEPWLLEWNSDEIAGFESETATGIALVKYDGATVQLLRDCAIIGNYGEFKVIPSRPRQTHQITSVVNAKASLGISFVSLQGSFDKGEQWLLEYVISGFMRSSSRNVNMADLPAGCEGATHFVREITFGAYNFSTGASRKVDGSIETPDVAPTGPNGNIEVGGEDTQFKNKKGGVYSECSNFDAHISPNDPKCQGMLKVRLKPIEM